MTTVITNRPTGMYEVMAMPEDTTIAGPLEQFFMDLDAGIHAQHYDMKIQEQRQRLERYGDRRLPVLHWEDYDA